MKHATSYIVFFQYFISIIVLLCGGKSLLAQNDTKRIDSLENIFPYQSGEEKINTLYKLSDLSDLPNAIHYDSLALEESLAINDSTWISKILIDIGYLYIDSYHYNKARRELNRALLISKQMNNELQIFECYKALGIYYYNLNVYDSALYNHYEALKIIEKKDDKINHSKILNNIGIIYYVLDDSENAIDYYSKALELKLEAGDTAATFLNYYNIGLIHSADNEYNKAIYNFLKAVQIAEKYKDSNLPYAYTGLGQVYVKTNNIEEAKKYLNKSLEYSKEINDQILESRTYYDLAKLKTKIKQFDKALMYLKLSQKIATELSQKQRIKNNYKLYAEIFESLNFFDSAYYYQKEYSKIEDSIFNERLTKNLAKVQLNKQKEESQEVIAEKDENITQKTKLSQLLAVVLVLSVLLIIIVTRNYIQSNRINKRLQESKDELEKQKETVEKRNMQLADAQKTIETQNERLKNVNVELENAVRERTKELEQSNVKLEKAVKDLDDFIYRTSHDLRGPIATMQGIIQIALMETNLEQVNAYFKNLREISDTANEKLHKLIEVHKMYLKQPELEKINVENILNEAVDSARLSDDESRIDLKVEFNANGSWVSDKYFFKSIIENMITNAFLFSLKNNPFVKVKICEESSALKMIFEDNGFGIQDEDKNKVFDVFFKGAPNRSGTGLEIYAARIAVEKLRGNINLSNPRKNTIYEITLPTLEV